MSINSRSGFDLSWRYFSAFVGAALGFSICKAVQF